MDSLALPTQGPWLYPRHTCMVVILRALPTLPAPWTSLCHLPPDGPFYVSLFSVARVGTSRWKVILVPGLFSETLMCDLLCDHTCMGQGMREPQSRMFSKHRLAGGRLADGGLHTREMAVVLRGAMDLKQPRAIKQSLVPRCLPAPSLPSPHPPALFLSRALGWSPCLSAVKAHTPSTMATVPGEG